MSPEPREGAAGRDARLAAKLQDLVDRSEILDCLTRYTRGMDRQDIEMVRSAYHDDAVDMHTTWVGDVDDFLGWTFKYHGKQLRHQHYVTNHTVDIDGDVAHAETYYMFVATYPDPDEPVTMVGGRYVDRLERRADRWAIAARVCTREWWTEVPARQFGEALDPGIVVPPLRSTRDGSDLSYERPLVVRPADAG